MQLVRENKQYELFERTVEKEQAEPDENWKKSIPAQVFLNHFFAISFHIGQAGNAYSLHQNVRFAAHKPQLSGADLEQLQRHLLNCWSTEHALRATGQLGGDAFMRNALHWTFPQAYYSVFAGVQAFLHTLGIRGNHEGLFRREIGRLVVRGYYPEPIGFYAAGHYDQFSVHRLPLAKYKPGLQLATQELEAQAQIGQFLRTTRRLVAQGVRQAVQNNPDTALRSARTGDVLQKFSQDHWNQLTWRFGYTTYFDLLCRLRISANHREIERFVEAEIDFKLFHQSLLEMVEYLNCIHEAYVAKAMGLEAYRKMVTTLPAHLRDGFVKDRLVGKIEPILRMGSQAKDEPLELSA
ncbi:MAG TPA: hypothetical protein VF646_03865 [Cytophagales bacterium]